MTQLGRMDETKSDPTQGQIQGFLRLEANDMRVPCYPPTKGTSMQKKGVCMHKRGASEAIRRLYVSTRAPMKFIGAPPCYKGTPGKQLAFV